MKALFNSQDVWSVKKEYDIPQDDRLKLRINFGKGQ